MQVHGIGGAAGVLWYALMAKKELVTELYGEASSCVLRISGLCISQHVVLLVSEWLCAKHSAQSLQPAALGSPLKAFLWMPKCPDSSLSAQALARTAGRGTGAGGWETTPTCWAPT